MANTGIDTILVVVKGEDDGEIVIDKAYKLARHAGASLHVVMVVHDDFADLSVHDHQTREQIRNYVRQTGETVLEELIDPVRNHDVDIESACIWHKYQWRAVLDVAAQISADLIIKGTDYPVNAMLRTPSDWNLLRHAEIPVLLVKPINWVDQPVILAAIDATEDEDQDLNKRVLKRAADIARALSGDLHVISTFPSVEHWVGPITLAIDFNAVRKQVRREIIEKVKALVHELGIDVAHIHTSEGKIEEEIQRTVEETGAEITVMGTHHRAVPSGVFLGNASEKILYSVRSDVEVLR